MAFQIVYWNTEKKFCCNDNVLPQQIILGIDPTLMQPQGCPSTSTGGGYVVPAFPAELLDYHILNNECARCPVYRYTIRYDDSILLDPSRKLTQADIRGIMCFDFLLEILIAALGNEVYLDQNQDGSYSLFSQHGCEYVFTPAGVLVEDTQSLDLNLAGNTLSGNVNISSAPGNVIGIAGDGLYVAQLAGLSVSDTFSVTLALPGTNLTADVKISADGGNILTLHADGLYVSNPGALITSLGSTNTTNNTEVMGTLFTDVRISADPGNIITAVADGLFVPPDFIVSATDTQSVDLTVAGGILSADVIISPDPGNILVLNANGLYVPTDADFINSIIDTVTVDLDVSAGALSANVNTWAINADGWIDAHESWSAASATTITVPTDATLKYAVGDKIRLVQDATTKYFYVISVAATLLTVTGGTDYTLSGNPITVPFYSHALSPVGHPQRFTYTPTFTGFSVVPATPEVQWSLFGKMAHLAISTGEGTSNADDFTVSLLVPMMTTVNTFSARAGGMSGTDNSTFAGNIMATISSLAPTILQFFKDSGAVGWTAAGNKAASATIDYPIA